jgi:ABC-type cobalamin/Fe3+-siderophores transport system ATPase subunit
MTLEAQKLTGGYENIPIVKDIHLSIETGEWQGKLI